MAKHDVDKYFPRNGSCMFHRTRYARHRLIDAIKVRHKAGDSIAKLAADYELSRPAIQSTPDDNRMTLKEIEESDAEYMRLCRKKQ